MVSFILRDTFSNLQKTEASATIDFVSTESHFKDSHDGFNSFWKLLAGSVFLYISAGMHEREYR